MPLSSAAMMSLMDRITKKLHSTVLRNAYSISGMRSEKNRVNLEWWSKEVNIGDVLSKCIFEWMLKQKNCDPDYPTGKTIHLLAVGSVLGMRNFDAVVWGSGIHTLKNMYKIQNNRKTVKYDIRAVRGPVTKAILESAGYQCQNAVLGDPAVLMPKIYSPKVTEKKYKYSLIMHLSTKEKEKYEKSCHCISVKTEDYKNFINEIVASELIISSSLHGIILAEAYQIPAVFINENKLMNKEILKFFDWYYSTGRDNVVIAHSIEEALSITPMELPKLDEMQGLLIKAFPYDLWKN